MHFCSFRSWIRGNLPLLRPTTSECVCATSPLLSAEILVWREERGEGRVETTMDRRMSRPCLAARCVDNDGVAVSEIITSWHSRHHHATPHYTTPPQCSHTALYSSLFLARANYRPSLLCRETDQQRKIWEYHWWSIWRLFILIIQVKIDKILSALVEQNLNGRHSLQHLRWTSGGHRHHSLQLLLIVDWSSQWSGLEEDLWWRSW